MNKRLENEFRRYLSSEEYENTLGDGSRLIAEHFYRLGVNDMKKEINKTKALKPFTVPLLAVTHYGAEHQKRKAIEEMGELITELEREQDGRTTPQKIITEIADVLLTVRQLMVIYGIEPCLAEYEKKQRRLLRRMDKETGGDYRKNKDDGNQG